ncbi:MAG: M23 family metallopeptidase [Candidatus Omnitrophota bacterium]
MKRIKKIILVIAVIFLVVFLYRPVSILIFHLREPKFLCPIDSVGIKIRSDGYGSGEFGAKRSGGKLHLGIDIQAKVGTQVKAAKSGRARIGKIGKGMGKHIVINHPDGTKTIYGHLSKIFVTNNQKVKRGDIIGEVGKTGNAWPRTILPHLHFEIRIDGEPVDPFAGYMEIK